MFSKVILAAVLTFHASAYAQNISINQAVSKALDQKSEVLNAHLDTEILNQLYKRSYSAVFPVVNIGYRRNFGAKSYNNQNLTNKYANVSIKQSLTAPFTKAYDIYLAKLQFEKSKIESQDVRLRKTTEIYGLYFLIQKLREDLKISEENLNTTGKYASIAARRYRSGLIDASAKTRAELLTLQIKNYRREIIKNIKVAELELAYQFGMDQIKQPIHLSTRLPTSFKKLEVTPDKLSLKERLGSSNKYNLAKMDLKIAQAESKQSKLNMLPSLFVEYNYNHLVSRSSDELAPKQSTTSLGVEWDIPVAGRDYFAFMAAKTSAQKARNTVVDSERFFATKVRQILEELNQLRANHQYLLGYSKSLKDITKVSRKKFNRGLIDAFLVGQDIEKQLVVDQDLTNVRYNIVQKTLELALSTSDAKVLELLF